MRTREIENNPLGRVQLRLSDAQLRMMKVENQKTMTVPIYDDIENDPPLGSIEGQIALSRADLKVWWFSNQAWHTCGVCDIDGYVVGELYPPLYVYGSFGDGEGYLCKGPDGEPWVAFNEGHSYYVGGGSIRGPFVFRWNGSNWVFVSSSATTDGGVGTQQPWAGDPNGATDHTFYSAAFLPPGGWTGQWGYGIPTEASGSFATGAEVGFPAKDASHNPQICTDGTSVYVIWQWLEQTWDPLGPPEGTIIAVLHSWRVRRYSSGTWTELGTPPNSHNTQGSQVSGEWPGSKNMRMRANATGVYVWYWDFDGANHKFYVAHWTGSAWTDLGGEIIVLTNSGFNFGSYIDMQVDGSGQVTLFGMNNYIGGNDDEIFALTYRGGSWHLDTYAIDWPNFDIPDGLNLLVQGVSSSPITPHGDYVVGAQCNRDGYESYFLRYNPSTGAWSKFRDGAKLIGTSPGGGQVISFQMTIPQANDELWITATHYGGASETGPHLWVYMPKCGWFIAPFSPPAVGPTTSGDSGLIYRDGRDVYLLDSIVAGYSGGNPYSWIYLWHGRTAAGIQSTPERVPTIILPTNDNFANAIELTGDSGTKGQYDLNRMTLESGEPTPSAATFGFAQSIWFKWTAPSSSPVTFDTIGSLDSNQIRTDTVLAIYTGTSLGSLSQVVSNDDISGSNLNSRVIFTPSAGTQYYIQIGTAYQGAAGAATINWST